MTITKCLTPNGIKPLDHPINVDRIINYTDCEIVEEEGLIYAVGEEQFIEQKTDRLYNSGAEKSFRGRGFLNGRLNLCAFPCQNIRGDYVTNVTITIEGGI